MRDPAIEITWMGLDIEHERAWRRCMCCKTDESGKLDGLWAHSIEVSAAFAREHRTFRIVKVVTCASHYCRSKLRELAELEALRTRPVQARS